MVSDFRNSCAFFCAVGVTVNFCPAGGGGYWPVTIPVFRLFLRILNMGSPVLKIEKREESGVRGEEEKTPHAAH
jgi:hypothetical protein